MTTEPECRLGYSEQQVERILATNNKRTDDFNDWMFGATMALCDGRIYNADSHLYEPSACFQKPHGAVVYTWDMDRFLAGLPNID